MKWNDMGGLTGVACVRLSAKQSGHLATVCDCAICRSDCGERPTSTPMDMGIIQSLPLLHDFESDYLKDFYNVLNFFSKIVFDHFFLKQFPYRR